MLKFAVFHPAGSLGSNNHSGRINFAPTLLHQPRRPRMLSLPSCCSSLSNKSAQSLVHRFNPKVPIEDAETPPSQWYTDLNFYSLELDRVFYRGWQVAGYVDQIKNAHDYFTGSLGNVEYVICRDNNGTIHAFHNVCRHHASVVAYGTGRKSCLVCPYHGWTYGLDGALLKATRISVKQQFDSKEFGLVPISVATWGPFVVVNLENDLMPHEAGPDSVRHNWLGSCSDVLVANGVDTSLHYVCRREYVIDCNWKVFCDNYLDGGYHVPYAHKSLASGLKLDSYTTEIFEKVSIQRCESSTMETKDDCDRLGTKAFYAFVYPNFMINRYGPWMDTNLVVPLGPRKCKVVFDYFLDESLKDDKAYIDGSLEDSGQVQVEDIMLCEGVQRGLESPAYSTGKYVAEIEQAMHHFHCLLHESLRD